jgi:hypothetical protein
LGCDIAQLRILPVSKPTGGATTAGNASNFHDSSNTKYCLELEAWHSIVMSLKGRRARSGKGYGTHREDCFPQLSSCRRLMGLAVFQNLTQDGYDVFIVYYGIASGNFETIILENIRARAHFLLLLTPTALERCGDPSDWMRREIEPLSIIRLVLRHIQKI